MSFDGLLPREKDRAIEARASQGFCGLFMRASV